MMMLVLATAIRAVPEYRRLVVFRLGRHLGQRGPGLVLLLPFIDVGVPVDLREQPRKLEKELVLTSQSIRLLFDVSYIYRVLDPNKAVLAGALHPRSKPADQPIRDKLAGLLRQAVGELDLNEVTSGRSALAAQVQAAARQSFEPWGVELTGLEVRDVLRG
jgi:regulator of protease activity HflC (stomatin/prohibitin superfamily)